MAQATIVPPDATTIKYAAWRDASKGVGQWYVHQSLSRFRTLMAGRQSGKTMCALAEICVDAMGHPGHIDWWIVNNMEVKPRAWRGLLDFLPKGIIAKTNENDRRIRLINGSEIFVKSAAGDDSLVSESLDFVVCDEAGLWKRDAWERGVSPMLTARPDARVLLIGTPRSKNWFYEMWLRGMPGPKKDKDYDSFHWKSADSPFTDKAYLAERRRNMRDDLYREEFEADPLDNTGGIFRNVRACIRTGTLPADPMTVIGADLARKIDFSCFIPMNSSRQAMAVYRSQEDWSLQKTQLVRLSMMYGFARIIADSGGVGDPFISQLREAGLQVQDYNTQSSSDKRIAIDHLALAFENGTISIPDDQVLIDELESYTYETLPSGQIRYSAPEGGHDDTVIALALATWGQRGAMGLYARPDLQPSTYMGRGGTGSYMNSRKASTWPL